MVRRIDIKSSLLSSWTTSNLIYLYSCWILFHKPLEILFSFGGPLVHVTNSRFVSLFSTNYHQYKGSKYWSSLVTFHLLFLQRCNALKWIEHWSNALKLKWWCPKMLTEKLSQKFINLRHFISDEQSLDTCDYISAWEIVWMQVVIKNSSPCCCSNHLMNQTISLLHCYIHYFFISREIFYRNSLKYFWSLLQNSFVSGQQWQEVRRWRFGCIGHVGQWRQPK